MNIENPEKKDNSNNTRIVVMYRLKDAERWITKSIESILDICSEIVILDDGSTDKTVEICSKYDKVVDIYQQKDLPFDETRDRNTIFKIALKRKPDFIFALDGDEILMNNSKKILLEEINVLHSDADVFEFQFLDMWDKPNQYRYDGQMSNRWARKLIRMKKQFYTISIFREYVLLCTLITI